MGGKEGERICTQCKALGMHGGRKWSTPKGDTQDCLSHRDNRVGKVWGSLEGRVVGGRMERRKEVGPERKRREE
eukprot:5339536-Karenia_brevis.AAC.1